MNEKELREAVRAEFGGIKPSALVDRKMRAAYASLGEMPKPRAREKKGKTSPLVRAFRTAGIALGGFCAAFLILIGLSAANPAIAAGVPFLGDILDFIQGKNRNIDSLLSGNGVADHLNPVVSQPDEPGFRIAETYYDGEVLVLTTALTLPEAPEEYRELSPEFQFSFSAGGKSLSPAWNSRRNWSMLRAEGATYVGSATLYLKDEVLPDAFDLTVGFSSLAAIDTQLMVLDSSSGTYQPKTYQLDPPEPFSCPVKKDESLRKIYEVNKTLNGCTVEGITVTPALTEIRVDTEKDGITIFVYDSQGNPLEPIGQLSHSSERLYRTLDKDETAVTVKFFSSDNRYDPVAAFTIPVEGGYYEEPPRTAWNDDAPVVYDPPLEEAPLESGTLWWGVGGATASNAEMPDGEPAELGESLRLSAAEMGLADSGSMDVTVSNFRCFESWQEAGVEERDMLVFDDPKRLAERSQGRYFVMLDLELETHDSIPGDYEENRAETIPEGSAVYWISSVIMPCPVSADSRVTVGEIDYFSHHGNGLRDYYHFTMGENEKKTVQVGFFVPREQLDSNDLQFQCGSYLVRIPPAAQE